MEPYTEQHVPNQSGRTILVTGANTGIGYEAARVLAGRGARVLLGCRSPEKAGAARERIRALHPEADVQVLELDLGSLQSVRTAATRVRDQGQLDVLINNAGIMIPPRQETEDGFESQFGVNHLGHFALTGLLLDGLRRRPGARVVTVSSGAHRWGKIDFEDVHATQRYRRQARYGMSKLANLLFTHELQRRLAASGDSAIAVACHPGISETELSRHFPGWANLLRPVLSLVMPSQSAAMGALPTLRAATDPEVQGGEYYGPDGRGELRGPPVRVTPNDASRDAEVADRLWDLSVKLTGVDPAIG
jgi:NAD(P)-dependent dehydrogenase (short-subunit alcohol dehydrogenase family)